MGMGNFSSQVWGGRFGPDGPFEKVGNREIPRNPSCYDVLWWAIILESNNIRLHQAASNKEERERERERGFSRSIRVLASSKQSVKTHPMIVYKIKVWFICTWIVAHILLFFITFYSDTFNNYQFQRISP